MFCSNAFDLFVPNIVSPFVNILYFHVQNNLFAICFCVVGEDGRLAKLPLAEL